MPQSRVLTLAVMLATIAAAPAAQAADPAGQRSTGGAPAKTAAHSTKPTKNPVKQVVDGAHRGLIDMANDIDVYGAKAFDATRHAAKGVVKKLDIDNK